MKVFTTCPTAYIDAVIARIKATKRHDAKTVDVDAVRDALATAPYMPPYQGINGGWACTKGNTRPWSRPKLILLPCGETVIIM
jgi:hypothetical protein